MNKNPYTISFGRIPKQFISRGILVEDIADTLISDAATDRVFKLTGISGSGKTVTLKAIEEEIKEDKSWIVVNLTPDSDLDAALNKADEINANNKRLLVVIDDARKAPAMIGFINEFQNLVNNEYPIYLIMAGLYEDIESIENAEGADFLLKAAKYELEPLNMNIIKEDYKRMLGVDDNTAIKLAKMTKGYAYAYQVFGKFMWDSGQREITDFVLAQVDDALEQKIYRKIWSELSETDRKLMEVIAKKDVMTATELFERTKLNHSTWSRPRKRLIEKGLIDCRMRGIITLKLPRFREFINREKEFYM